MTAAPPTRSSRTQRVWIGLAIALVLIALIAYPYWKTMAERQERIDTQWSATMFLNVYLRDQAVPPMLLAPGFPPSTVETRLIATEQRNGKPLHSYHILEWHFGDAGGSQVADLYY